MRTQARAGADADVPTSPADRHGAGRIREQLPSLILIAVAGGLVAAFFLALYAVKQYPMPIGWDTPRYLDQTNLVAAHGLAGVPQHLPPLVAHGGPAAQRAWPCHCAARACHVSGRSLPASASHKSNIEECIRIIMA